MTLMEDLPQVSVATSAKTARTMMVLLQEVIQSGTAAAAAVAESSAGREDGDDE